jgi:hypothetical protein
VSERTCTGCKETFPATLEYFHKDKRKLSGVSSKCKDCRNRYTRKYNKENPELQTQYSRARRNAPCLIYRIVNTKTLQIYIGETTVGIYRWGKHKSNLRRQKHESPALQEDWNKYGEEAFVFEIIEELPCDTSRDLLLKKEEKYIKQYLNEGKLLYNVKRSKLTRDQARTMRKEYAAGGITQRQLAKKYGVSLGNTNHIIHNKSWKET